MARGISEIEVHEVRGGDAQPVREIGEQGIYPRLGVDHVPPCKLGDHPQNPGNQDAPQDITGNLVMVQHGSQKEPNHEQHRLGAGERTQGDHRARIGNDQTRSFEADERDEQADACGDSHLQVLRHVIDQRLPELAQRQHDEDQTLAQHGGKSHFPRILDARFRQGNAHGICEEGIQTHTACQRDGIVREEGHEQRCRRRRNGRRCEHRRGIHARSRKDRRVHR